MTAAVSMDEEKLDPRLPFAQEAEMALLGAILYSNKAFERVSGFLKPEHFAYRVHGRIFAAIGGLIERGVAADPITLKQYLEADQALADIGGFEYLMQLAGSVALVSGAEGYGQAIHDAYVRRELIALGDCAIAGAAQGRQEHHEPDELVRQLEASLEGLHERAGAKTTGLRLLKAYAGAYIERVTEAQSNTDGLGGMATGIDDLDSLLGGMARSDLLILAGRPSQGKTAVAVHVALHAAGWRPGGLLIPQHMRRRVGFFSLEMSAVQILARCAAHGTGIPVSRQMRAGLQPFELEDLLDWSKVLDELPIHIDDTAALSIGELRMRARQMVRKHGLDLIVVDYLQLMRGSRTIRNENRVQEVSEITSGLKGLAKDLDVPVLALSQLSRAVEQRDDKRPQLADLRDSGSIEQDADSVIFVFREEYYLERAEPMQRHEESTDKYVDRQERWKEALEKCHKKVELGVPKNRHGPIGVALAHIDLATNRLSAWVTQ